MPGAIVTRCAKTEVSSKTLGLPDTTEHELIQALEDQGWKWERLPAKRRVSDEMAILQLEDDLSAPQVGDVGAQADPLADVVSAHREVGQDALEGDGEDTDSDGQIEDLLQLFQEDLPDQPVGSNGQVAAEIVAPRDMSLDLETGPMIPAEVEEPAAVPGPLPADSADA